MFLKILTTINSLINLCIPKVNINLSIGRKTYFRKNVFKTQHAKVALVSYLSTPFSKINKSSHTNYFECKYAAKALSDLGYNVDVIDYDHHEKISFKNYDILYGFGDQFEQSFYDENFKGKRILYSPGCNTVYSNLVSCTRLKEFAEHTGELNPRLIRATNDAWPLQKYLSNAIICVGNEFTVNTYKAQFSDLKYFQINCFPLERSHSIAPFKKDFKNAKNNLLWFGSQGSVHKGLDIAMALVDKNPNLNLYISGLSVKHESSILNNYRHLINNNRVHVRQHVDIESEEFVELMKNCGAVIFPSASEGSAPSILTVMSHGGLIPIITKSCGLDVENLGFVANNTATVSVESQLKDYLKKSDEELLELSQKIKLEINKTYNTENYQKNIKLILEEILN
jgi:glycosyltransferase involved in cell wall biosynthesis